MAANSHSDTPIACSIAPLLSVRNGARAVEFYKSAFGAVEVYRVEDPGGGVVSRLSVDGADASAEPRVPCSTNAGHPTEWRLTAASSA